jgi:hypothetical protein
MPRHNNATPIASIGHNGGPAIELIRADLIIGVGAIAAEIGYSKRQVEILLARGTLPGCGKSGHLWHASRRKLRAYFDAITSGEAA